jgi:hypothetical protein
VTNRPLLDAAKEILALFDGGGPDAVADCMSAIWDTEQVMRLQEKLDDLRVAVNAEDGGNGARRTGAG